MVTAIFEIWSDGQASASEMQTYGSGTELWRCCGAALAGEEMVGDAGGALGKEQQATDAAVLVGAVVAAGVGLADGVAAFEVVTVDLHSGSGWPGLRVNVMPDALTFARLTVTLNMPL